MTAGKVRDLQGAIRWRRGIDGAVVFTNGVFDILHPGHVAVLEEARGQGSALVVGINDDTSARRLEKGPGRPVLPAPDRARVVAALAAVDCVVIFPEDTPEALIRALAPDVLVKGADYRRDQLPGLADVQARGGRAHLVPLQPGYSTTGLIERIRAAT